MASTLLDQTSCTVTVDGVKPDEWVKVCLLVPCSMASYAGTFWGCHTIFLGKEHCVMSAKNVSVGGYTVHVPLDIYTALPSPWAVPFLAALWVGSILRTCAQCLFCFVLSTEFQSDSFEF